MQQSVEEYFFSQVAGHSRDDLKKEGDDQEDSDGVNNNVDRKMVEELAAFASQSERRRKTTSSEDSPSGDSDQNKDSSDQTKDSDQSKDADHSRKVTPDRGTDSKADTESGEDSPCRIPKPRLSKTQSAGILEAQKEKMPAKMTRRHTEKSFAEIADDNLLDVKDADDANTAESESYKHYFVILICIYKFLFLY